MAANNKKVTVSDFQNKQNTGEKITMLTAYDYSTAKILDGQGVDGLLIGDSLGMVMLGYDNTLQVTLEDILYHTKAVVRGNSRSLIVSDMPFLSYHVDEQETVKNAGKLVQEGGAEAVKLEGGSEIVDMLKAVIRAQIPVMGHLGLTPQSVNIMGGFKVQGKSIEMARKLVEDARALEQAGVFAIVLECVPAALAQVVTEVVSIPTIGIGAGSNCDGQILVTNDMLGMYSDFTPKFVKKYANVTEDIEQAVTGYINEVKDEAFPLEEHTFTSNEQVVTQLKQEFGLS